jgi:hypothetical protein
MNGDRPFWRSGSVLASLGVLVVVVVTDIVLRHLSGTPADFTLFVGRFHPLAVHLPIGVVLLVGAAEVATLSPRLRPRLEPAIGLALVPLAVLTAGTFLLGHLLARSGDFAPRLIAVHRRAELFAAVGICLLPLGWAYQLDRVTTRARAAYRALLGLTLVSLSAGAHFGGTLTHGDAYLTRYAPSPLRGLLGASEPKAAPSASSHVKTAEPHLFADVVQPLLIERCAPCHGAEKVKAGLRLDSLDAILKGGEDGAVVTPRAPDDSELLRRVLLPEDDDDHMPPEGKRGLAAPEIALLRFWIDRGADDRVLVRDLLVPPDAQKSLETFTASGGSAAPHPPAPATSASSPSSSPSATAPSPSAVTPTTTLAPSSSTPGISAPSPASTSAPSAASVLHEHCEKCHGPTKQKSKLRVDSVDALLAGGKTGPAIVPGNPTVSELIRRLSLPLDDDKHMPPKKEPQLTSLELTALSSFIRSLRASPTPASPASHSPASAPTPASTSPSTPSSPSTPASAPASDSPPDPDPPDPALLSTLPSHLPLYSHAIAPLLRSHCDKCHSGSSPSGGLRVAPHASLLSGGDTGPAVTPRDPLHSVLVTRIRAPLDDGDHMPPEGEAQLDPDDIALIVAWIEQGAGESDSIETATLPAPAVRALAAHPPEDAGPAPTGEHPSAQNAPRSGGCAACMVAERRASPNAAPWLAGVVVVSLLLRRAAAKRPERRPSPLRSG